MSVKKVSTGIAGLDKILHGGYLADKPTLLKGNPGSGKTIFTLFFAHAQLAAGKKVLYVSCDEKPAEILVHMDNFNLQGTKFKAKNKLIILDFTPELDEVVGEFDLNVLLLRISQARKKAGADILIIDSLHSLFLGLTHDNNLPAEILKLFQWASHEKLTLLTTMAGHIDICRTKFYEEYIVDCIIELKQKVTNNLMTRYLRVLKLRGSSHGTNEYPFAIVYSGISLIPITETRLETKITKKYLSTGIQGLDKMLGNKGYQKGSSIMISGKSGTAKSIFAALFAQSAALQGQKVLYVSFEESPADLVSHFSSINLHLKRFIKTKKLTIISKRSVEMGLEDHIISLVELANREQFDVLILDPISALLDLGSLADVKFLFIRFISYLAASNKTLLLTELIPEYAGEKSVLGLSSLTTTWLHLTQIASNAEFNRMLYIAKSRGLKTSNQIKEFVITDQGITIEDPYIHDKEMVFGSQKEACILKDKQAEFMRNQEIQYLTDELIALEETLKLQRKINELRSLTRKNAILHKKSNLLKENEQRKEHQNTNKMLRDE
ncbi:DNA integration/recombination/inversion protein [Legionella busanensis]|uniref:non-specific serine/threonine protein kinase n=1 Tax=Legionella busanensis TaxID=190655 RepID=A0A378JJQ0_9GAMM|nr:circadian clock protein KaiC [Legionella busanensis]STX50400.1 DNA integration/recombination/inversion protein [Legionella busanensis]